MKKSGLKITVTRATGAAALFRHFRSVAKVAAYVGVPSTTSRERSDQLLNMASKAGKKRSAKLRKAAQKDISNAETLFLLSKGSPIHHQPPRPVLEPAIEADGNKQPIERELAAAVKASLAGDRNLAIKYMQRAALAGQNAARSWFTDPRNNWAPNAPSTIAAKGSDRPGIDTGATRAAIQGLVAEE